MDIDQIYSQFRLFAGLSEVQAGDWLPLCRASARRIEAARLPDTPADDERLVLAAAGDAYYQYTLTRAAGNAQSFRIGDISVSESANSTPDGVRQLRDELLANAAGLLDCPFAGLRQVG